MGTLGPGKLLISQWNRLGFVTRSFHCFHLYFLFEEKTWEKKHSFLLFSGIWRSPRADLGAQYSSLYWVLSVWSFPTLVHPPSCWPYCERKGSFPSSPFFRPPPFTIFSFYLSTVASWPPHRVTKVKSLKRCCCGNVNEPSPQRGKDFTSLSWKKAPLKRGFCVWWSGEGRGRREREREGEKKGGRERAREWKEREKWERERLRETAEENIKTTLFFL